MDHVTESKSSLKFLEGKKNNQENSFMIKVDLLNRTQNPLCIQEKKWIV